METPTVCQVRDCGNHVAHAGGPVTTGGLYGDFFWRWDDGELRLLEWRCARCRVRQDWRPVEVWDGVWLVAGLETQWTGYDAAMDAIHAHALEVHTNAP